MKYILLALGLMTGSVLYQYLQTTPDYLEALNNTYFMWIAEAITIWVSSRGGILG